LVVTVAGTTVFQTYQTIIGGTSNNNRIYLRSRTTVWGPWETFAAADHLHDNVYYQKNEIDNKVDTANVTNVNRAAIINGSGKVSYSQNITTTELDYLNNLTSNIQDQLNDRYRKSETARIFVFNPANGSPSSSPQINDLWFW
jgi:hypothetical protein